jgi:hypothetical protein
MAYLGCRIEGICQQITNNAGMAEAVLRLDRKALEEEVH